eukprot:1679608-Ditylum_brightwellii.AAC.1
MFTPIHALECKSGGLTIVQHNEVQYELAWVGSQAYTKLAISSKPYVNTSWGGRHANATDPNSLATPTTLLPAAAAEL